MSLINQMLRDLEQRNNHAKPQAQPLAIRTPLATPGKNPRFGFLALLVLALGFVWYQMQAEQLADASRAAAGNTPAPALPAVVVSLPPPPAAKTQSLEADPAAKIGTPAMALAETKATDYPAAPANKLPAPTVMPAAPKPERQQLAQPSVKPASNRQQAEILYKHAQANNSSSTAREALQQAVLLNPLYLPARTQLLQTLLKSPADRAEALTLAEDSLQLFPDNLLFIKTRALFYLQEKNFADAASLLEKINADHIDDTGYLALLASAYQQLQQFPQALSIYQRLCQIQPEKAENWLGLAISQDKLNQPATAAYQQALDKNTLNPAVVDYIKQRLSALN